MLQRWESVFDSIQRRNWTKMNRYLSNTGSSDKYRFIWRKYQCRLIWFKLSVQFDRISVHSTTHHRFRLQNEPTSVELVNSRSCLTHHPSQYHLRRTSENLGPLSMATFDHPKQSSCFVVVLEVASRKWAGVCISLIMNVKRFTSPYLQGQLSRSVITYVTCDKRRISRKGATDSVSKLRSMLLTVVTVRSVSSAAIYVC